MIRRRHLLQASAAVLAAPAIVERANDQSPQLYGRIERRYVSKRKHHERIGWSNCSGNAALDLLPCSIHRQSTDKGRHQAPKFVGIVTFSDVGEVQEGLCGLFESRNGLTVEGHCAH